MFKCELVLRPFAAIHMLAIVLFFLVPLPMLANDLDSSSDYSTINHAADKIVVRFKPGTNDETTEQALRKDKSKKSKSKVRKFKFIDGLKLVTIPPGQDLYDVIERLRNNPNVLYVEPDYEYQQFATPNDPSYSSLWGLHNNGQNIWGQLGTVDVDINAPEAWDVTTGSSTVIIAVLDSGVNYTHPDLIDNMWTNPVDTANGVDDDGNGYIDDIHGIDAFNNDSNPMDDNKHGSHVAGTIAGVGNNSVGVSGVSQSSKIIACKIGDASGSISSSAAVICMDYIYDLKVNRGINIVATNNSWGGGGYSTAMYEAIEKHLEAGILFIAAAGNSATNNDTTPNYPSGYYLPNIIAVAATDNQDNLALFSQYGRRSVHIGAPGVGIYSTTLGTGYEFLQGTSMATPYVTGLVALLAAEDNSRDWKTLKNLTIAGGKVISSLNGYTSSSRRIRAWDTDGTGSMTCNNQTVSSTLYPVASSTTIVSGGYQELAFMNINCASPNGTVTVTGTGPETVNDIYLLDDGLGSDKAANDGIYTTQWPTPSTAGTYTLTFPDSQTINVTVDNTLSPYRQPQTTTYNYRDLSGIAPSALSDGGYYSTGVPFPIKFAGGNYTTVYFTSKGVISFHTPSSSANNSELPNTGFNTLVAPFWDDLDVTSGSFRIGSTASEFIFDWLVPHKNNAGTVQFQVVFTQNSSNILVNYKDVYFGNATYDNGASATVGMQIASSSGTQYSFNTASLSNNTALLWQLDTGAPTANAGTDQNVNGNTSVNLSGAGTDPDNGPLAYAWAQISGTSAGLTNANTANASFTAPNTTETLSFQLTVTDDAGKKDTDIININVTQEIIVEGTISLSSSYYTFSESIGTATITATRTISTVGAISVNYSTLDGTATAGSDYTETSGTLSWADGETGSKTFSVVIVDDSEYESDEILQVQLSNITTGATLGLTSANINISNNDSLLIYSQPEYSVNENEGTATITVKRQGTIGAVSVNYATTVGGTASTSTDYSATSGTLNWVDGDSSDKTFTIPITDDSVFENAKFVNITLSSPSGANIQTTGVRLYIYDNDTFIQFGSPEYSVNEGEETVSINVIRMGAANGTVSVDYSTIAGGTSTAGSDYTSISGTFTWPNGDSTIKTFSISITDDTDIESFETIKIQLSNPIGASISGDTRSVFIYDNEAFLQFSAPEYSINEGDGSATITVYRGGGSTGAVSVDYATIGGGSATSGTDFTATTGTLNWADGDTATKTFSVSLSDDSTSENPENIIIQLSNPVGATISLANINLYIYDNDAYFGFGIPEYSVNEGDGSVVISVIRRSSASGAVSVDYSTIAGSATAGSDYTATSGTLSWSDGETTDKTFSVTIADDATPEATENISLQLSNPIGASIATSDVTLYLYDNDTFFQYSAPEYSVSEGGSSINISVRRVGNASGAVSVDYATGAGTATAASDYTATSGTLNWSDGDSNNKSFTVTIADDTVFESYETIPLTLSNPVGGTINTPNTIIYLYDNDSNIRFTNPYMFLNEADGSILVSVIRYGDTTAAASVDYTTNANGTAIAGSDFSSTSGTLNWNAAEGGQKTFTINITDDASYESFETIGMTLSNAIGTSIQNSAGIVYLYDNESVVRFKLGYNFVYEGTAFSVISVIRYGAISSAASVDYTTVDNGTATVGSDYTATSGTLNWGAGVGGEKTFSIPINDDGTSESFETTGINLNNAVGADIISADQAIYLYDND